MTTRAERKARSRANAQRRGEQASRPPQERGPAVVQKLHRKSGLDWLLSKKRISPAQAYAGGCYGNDYRAISVDGMEPLRSCLDDEPKGGGGSRIAFSLAEVDAQARQNLAAAREALIWHEDMVQVCDAICGRQLTPREISPAQREAEKIEQTLRIALDLLAKHYRLTNYLKRA